MHREGLKAHKLGLHAAAQVNDQHLFSWAGPRHVHDRLERFREVRADGDGDVLGGPRARGIQRREVQNVGDLAAQQAR